MNNSFGKEEKLKSRKRIEQLFAEGKSVKAYPVIAVFLPNEDSVVHSQVGFSVSKKRFKKAVDRNLVKRRMREAYRLNKEILIERGTVSMMFIYVGKTIPQYAEVEKSVVKALIKLRDYKEEA